MKASKITAVDFFDDLTSSYARKRFFGGFSLLIVFCLVLVGVVKAHVTWPITNEIMVSVLIEIIAGSVIILGFYALYLYFIGASTAFREVNVTRPQDISERMIAMPKEVRHYMFWGRSGSFFRAYPLLELDRQARENKRNIVVDVLLPDPDDERLVRSYREILKALGEEPGDNPLLPNVLSTCMACAIKSSNNKHLDIKVHLSRFLPAFRVDLSDKGAILTQDDKKKSALFFDYGSEFYDMFRSTVTNERDVSREVTWDTALFAGLKLEEKSCDAKTLKAFGINVGDVDAIQQEVARLITVRPHRYG
ncbi:hypothetical protein E2A64_13390 [Pseudohoeflea suaedae]|uniref:DUF3137 domain-containing protein n=1 Tax=Pseudohoeflea suaedae TaxID=877384 RepID=A0A4R5PKL8_9HYPH|nr:hypothetical protein [Pseudohoeflea suaedae]TDH36271.1 hypothetical protein E2A64_13390 [Pseudohoeflea suaedae]